MTTAVHIKTEPKMNPITRFLPILAWLPAYQRTWLRADLIAGLTVVALLIPEGMAYAEIAGVPPQAAFYAAPIGLLMFATFGTSRQLVVAVSAAIATMSYATVSAVVQPETTEFILMTAALAVLAGIIAILAGILKLGQVAQFFSESVMVGFISGLAILIAMKQLPKIFGIEGASGNFWERLHHLVTHLPETHQITLVVGIICLVLMILLEHYFERIPAALVAMLAGILISAAFSLDTYGVKIVGDLPAGLALPQWPAISLQSWLMLLPGAFGLALVIFAEAIGPSRSFAAAHNYKIDANQEFIGLGAANLGAGLFQGFPIGSSLSKSAANDQAGANSQMSGIIAAVVTGLVALFFTQFFYYLPEATLGAIVVVAVARMVKVEKMKHLYHVRRADFVLALVALLAALTLETLQALLFAVIVSLFALVWHSSKPKLAVLGRVPDSLNYRDIRRHPENKTLPGLLMLRPENGLFFANAAGVHDAIMREFYSSREPYHAVLIDLSATTDLDVPSADMLAELHKELLKQNARFMLSHVITPVRQILERAGAMEEIRKEDIFSEPAEAVLGYLFSQYSETEIREMVRSGLQSVCNMLQSHQSMIPSESQASFKTLADTLNNEIERIKSEGQQVIATGS